MQIIWMGHASFRIEIAGLTLLVDPWLTGNPMLAADQHDAATKGATHILLTHGHFDHVVDVLPLLYWGTVMRQHFALVMLRF